MPAALARQPNKHLTSASYTFYYDAILEVNTIANVGLPLAAIYTIAIYAAVIYAYRP